MLSKFAPNIGTAHDKINHFQISELLCFILSGTSHIFLWISTKDKPKFNILEKNNRKFLWKSLNLQSFINEIQKHLIAVEEPLKIGCVKKERT